MVRAVIFETRSMKSEVLYNRFKIKWESEQLPRMSPQQMSTSKDVLSWCDQFLRKMIFLSPEPAPHAPSGHLFCCPFFESSRLCIPHFLFCLYCFPFLYYLFLTSFTLLNLLSSLQSVFLNLSFLGTPGPKPRKWCCHLVGWIFLPQLT